MPSLPCLRLVLCLMALSPMTTILAAPVAMASVAAVHAKIAPPPPPKQKVTTTTTAKNNNARLALPTITTAISLTTSTSLSIPKPTISSPSTTITELPAPADSTPSTPEVSIPPLTIPVTDESGEDAHAVALPVLEGRSAEAKSDSSSTSSSSSKEKDDEKASSPPPALIIPVTDESGPEAHILSPRAARLQNRSAELMAEIRSETEGEGVPAPPVIKTEDDNSNCADDKGGCDIRFAPGV